MPARCKTSGSAPAASEMQRMTATPSAPRDPMIASRPAAIIWAVLPSWRSEHRILDNSEFIREAVAH